MRVILFVILSTLLLVDLSNQQEWDTTEITGYHFHTYFFQDNVESEMEAFALRESIQELSETFLAGCRLNRMNYAPIGPHVIGSYETCCNSSSLARAQSFFMQNRGNLSVLLHPLTRYEKLDHTTRAMWIGKQVPLDVDSLREDIGPGYHDEDKCLPIDLNERGGAKLVVSDVNSMIVVLFLYFCVNFKLF
ncbi:DOPA 4,5-dioxygenase-like isoform X1 [Bradysia coprophila]|uniref:DOPA 4,5-dioxygenase-like isoform X1 n=1 Tax=Bradysia coprophila TaxID=38358 RepID=UPI00187D8815|nr:DOPA 4,5-dioxygenase-like isoform X1 [Bradysia coprophila]XP_037029783.1 DOPA 4,5-dioxygenase-like isoform X1 [Bradysia coprophila]